MCFFEYVFLGIEKNYNIDGKWSKKEIMIILFSIVLFVCVVFFSGCYIININWVILIEKDFLVCILL